MILIKLLLCIIIKSILKKYINFINHIVVTYNYLKILSFKIMILFHHMQ